jgi:mycoredoxin
MKSFFLGRHQEMAEIVMYSTQWCGDCRRAKQFLRDRGVSFREVNIDEAPEAEELVLRVNKGRRKVPTIELEGRYFACSPFDPYQLSEELKIPLNPPRPS